MAEETKDVNVYVQNVQSLDQIDQNISHKLEEHLKNNHSTLKTIGIILGSFALGAAISHTAENVNIPAFPIEKTKKYFKGLIKKDDDEDDEEDDKPVPGNKSSEAKHLSLEAKIAKARIEQKMKKLNITPKIPQNI